MIALGNLLIGLSAVLGSLIWLFQFLVIAAVVLSWVSPDPRNPIVQFIYGTTEPVFAKVRSYVKPIGMLDLSPIIVLLALVFLNLFLVQSLAEYGASLKLESAIP